MKKGRKTRKREKPIKAKTPNHRRPTFIFPSPARAASAQLAPVPAEAQPSPPFGPASTLQPSSARSPVPRLLSLLDGARASVLSPSSARNLRPSPLFHFRRARSPARGPSRPRPTAMRPTCSRPSCSLQAHPGLRATSADFGSRAGSVHVRNARATIPAARTPRITPAAFLTRPTPP